MTFRQAALCLYFSVGLGCCPYEIFRDRSGLPDGHFAMLMLAVGTLRSSRAMTLIVLATICYLACVFLLFVLFQWTLDTKRKTTARTAVDDAAGETNENKRLQVVGSQRTVEKTAPLGGHAGR